MRAILIVSFAFHAFQMMFSSNAIGKELQAARQAERFYELGAKAADRREYPTAALYFIKAADSEPDEVRSRNHRLRAASTAAASPQLLQLTQLHFKPTSIMASVDGSTLLAVGNSEIALFDSHERSLKLLETRVIPDMRDAVLSPSGRFVAVSYRDANATVLLDRALEEQLEVAGWLPNGSDSSRAFSADEELLATQVDKQISLWSIDDGNVVSRSQFEDLDDNGVYALAFSPVSATALAECNRSNYLWHYKSNAHEKASDGIPLFKPHSYSVWGPNAAYLIHDDSHSMTDRWNPGEAFWRLTPTPSHPGFSRSKSTIIPWQLLSPDYRHALGFQGNHLSLYATEFRDEYENSRLICRMPFPSGLQWACFCCGSSAITTISRDGQICLWDITFKHPLEAWIPHADSLSADGNRALRISRDNDKNLEIIATENTSINTQIELPDVVNYSAFCVNDDYIVIGTGDTCAWTNTANTAGVFLADTGERLYSLTHDAPVSHVDLSRDLRHAFVVGGGKAVIWNLRNKRGPQKVLIDATTSDPVVVAMFSHNAKHAFTILENGRVVRRELRKLTSKKESALPVKKRVLQATLSPDDSLLAVLQEDYDNSYFVNILNTASMECEASFPLICNAPRSAGEFIAFSENGTYIQSDGEVYAWKEGRPLRFVSQWSESTATHHKFVSYRFQTHASLKTYWHIGLPVDSPAELRDYIETIAGAQCNNLGAMEALQYTERAATLTRVRSSVPPVSTSVGSLADRPQKVKCEANLLPNVDLYKGSWLERKLLARQMLDASQPEDPTTMLIARCALAAAHFELGNLDQAHSDYNKAIQYLDRAKLSSESEARWRQSINHLAGLIDLYRLRFDDARDAIEIAIKQSATESPVGFIWPDKLDHISQPSLEQLLQILQDLSSPKDSTYPAAIASSNNQTYRPKLTFKTLRELGETDHHAALFIRHLELAFDPQDLSLRYEQARLIYRLGKLDVASALLERLIKHAPQHFQMPHLLLGVIHHESGRLEQAIPLLNRTAEPGNRLPVRTLALRHLSDIYLKMGDLKHTLSTLKMLADLTPEESQHAMNIALLADELKQHDIRDSMLDRMHKHLPDDTLSIWSQVFLKNEVADEGLILRIEQHLLQFKEQSNVPLGWPILMYGYLSLVHRKFENDPKFVQAIWDQAESPDWQMVVGKALLLARHQDAKSGILVMNKLVEQTGDDEEGRDSLYIKEIDDPARNTLTRACLAILYHLSGDETECQAQLALARQSRDQLSRLAFWRETDPAISPKEVPVKFITDLLQAESECDLLIEHAHALTKPRLR